MDLDEAVAELQAAADALTNAVCAVAEERGMDPARMIFATAVMLSSMVEILPAVTREQAAADVIKIIQTGLAEAMAADPLVPEEAVPA